MCNNSCGNNWCWIIILLLLFCNGNMGGCGIGGGCGCNGGTAYNNGCGCDNGCGC